MPCVPVGKTAHKSTVRQAALAAFMEILHLIAPWPATQTLTEGQWQVLHTSGRIAYGRRIIRMTQPSRQELKK